MSPEARRITSRAFTPALWLPQNTCTRQARSIELLAVNNRRSSAICTKSIATHRRSARPGSVCFCQLFGWGVSKLRAICASISRLPIRRRRCAGVSSLIARASPVPANTR
jgi:hypothetical protein